MCSYIRLSVCPSIHPSVPPPPYSPVPDGRTDGRTDKHTNHPYVVEAIGDRPHPPSLTTPLKWGIRVPMTTNASTSIYSIGLRNIFPVFLTLCHPARNTAPNLNYSAYVCSESDRIAVKRIKVEAKMFPSDRSSKM